MSCLLFNLPFLRLRGGVCPPAGAWPPAGRPQPALPPAGALRGAPPPDVARVGRYGAPALRLLTHRHALALQRYKITWPFPIYIYIFVVKRTSYLLFVLLEELGQVRGLPWKIITRAGLSSRRRGALLPSPGHREGSAAHRKARNGHYGRLAGLGFAGVPCTLEPPGCCSAQDSPCVWTV